jgi:hypothetical protein
MLLCGGNVTSLLIRMSDKQDLTGRRRRLLYVVIPAISMVAILVVVYGVYGLNNLQLQSKVDFVILMDSRNKGVEVEVYYESPFNYRVIVYDMKGVSGDKSFADVFRVFLQFAERMRDSDLDYVKLAYQGRVKYILMGEDFKLVGLQYSLGENPVYIVRTFPEKLLLPNGRNAFPKWEGGLLAVTAKQLEDFNTFMKTWLELV